MEIEDWTARRSSPPHYSGCMASPSCLPAMRQSHHSSFMMLKRESGAAGERGRRWWKVLRRAVREVVAHSSSHSHKQATFCYDAASYAKNFDDGGGCRPDGPVHHRIYDSDLICGGLRPGVN